MTCDAGDEGVAAHQGNSGSRWLARFPEGNAGPEAAALQVAARVG